MSDSTEGLGNIIKMSRSKAKKFSDYTLITGFAGFGNVGYLSLTHIVENLEVESVAFWGQSSWIHNGNLESIITVFAHHSSKTLFVVPRLPIHVSRIPHGFWERLVEDLLAWNCRRYIFVGGLREDTRRGSDKWAAFVPNPQWRAKYKDVMTFDSHLPMIGPLSAMLTLGTALDKPVIGLLAYCNFEEDPEAAIIAINEIIQFLKLDMPKADTLFRFNYSFIPESQIAFSLGGEIEDFSDLDDDEDDDDVLGGYDLSDLI